MFSTLLWASCDCECYRKIVTVLLMHWKRLAFEVLWCMQSKMNIHRTYLNKKNPTNINSWQHWFSLNSFLLFSCCIKWCGDCVFVHSSDHKSKGKHRFFFFFLYLYIKFLAYSETHQLSRGNGLNRLYFINNMKIVQ